MPACFACRLPVSLATLALLLAARGTVLAGDATEFQPPPIAVPEGFVVEVAAAPPLVRHPTMACFDPQGRLYVCDGKGENLKADELLDQLPGVIRRLEDTDGDGVFDTATDFAAGMTFPMGCVWHEGSIYTASPPHIWRLTDADDDGVAERREKLISEFGFTGNAADIHGCFLGPDGRLYWCDGRHGHSFSDEHGQPVSQGLAARVFTCRPDGSELEAFAGGGMDNPVELTFTDEGEPLGTVAIFDMLDGRHDALVHWVYGGTYPKIHPCLEEFRTTGDLLPCLSRFGRVAPSGVMRYRGAQFGPEYRDNIFMVHFNTHNVVRTQIERSGATFISRDEDFLTCENLDFHLTDVLEDADGSLLAIDTGGWFRIGCPTSQIAKPEILGAIYRIRRADAAPLDDARGLQMAWENVEPEELLPRLSDERPAVRDRAVAALARLGETAAAQLHQVLASGDDALARRNAVWALCRIEGEPAMAALREALDDEDDSVRQSAVRALGTLRDEASLPRFGELAAADIPPIRREAATALGRIGSTSAVPLLLEALRGGGDRFLEHALVWALIQIDDPSTTLAGLSDASPHVRRGALVALDQMPSGKLTRELVAPLLDTDDAELQRAALQVIERHEGWSGELVGLLETWLHDSHLTDERAAMMRGALLAFQADAAVQQLVAHALSSEQTPNSTRLLMLEVISRSDFGGSELPSAWADQLLRHLAADDEQIARQAVTAVSALGLEQYDAALLTIANNSSRSEPLRVAALAVIAPRLPSLDDKLLALLTSRLLADVSPVDKLAAAEALGDSSLGSAQLELLLPVIAQAGPLELPPLLGAFAPRERAPLAASNSSDSSLHTRQLGLQLIAALEQSPGIDNLQPSRLEQTFSAYPVEVQEAARPLLKRLTVDVEQQQARLAELADYLHGGDAQRGAEVFRQKKTGCNACHRVNGEGPHLGPDLSSVGKIRAPRDLLEAVVFPSASFARGYESYQVVTSSGRLHEGVISRETAEAVYLNTAQREEIRIGRSDIEQMFPSRLSIMPQGFDKQLSPTELRDLLAYLQALKQ